MSIYALQSPAGGFLDEELKRFNKEFDEWCIQFDNFEDANIIAQTLDKKRSADVVEPYIGSNYRIAVCNLNTKVVTITNTSYKNVLSVEGAFASFEL